MSSNLVEHAKRELKLAGLLDEDSDYEGLVGRSVLDMIQEFSMQGHSGASALYTLDVLVKLLHYENLTPLTYEPDEWIDQSKISGTPMWQNKRNPRVFSEDGGKTHYKID